MHRINVLYIHTSRNNINPTFRRQKERKNTLLTENKLNRQTSLTYQEYSRHLRTSKEKTR